MRLWVLTVSFGRSPLAQCQWGVGVPPSYCPMGARPLGQLEEGLHSICVAEAQPSRCTYTLSCRTAPFLGLVCVKCFQGAGFSSPGHIQQAENLRNTLLCCSSCSEDPSLSSSSFQSSSSSSMQCPRILAVLSGGIGKRTSAPFFQKQKSQIESVLIFFDV